MLKQMIQSDVLHLNGFALLPVLMALLVRRPVVWSHYEYDTICPIGVAWWDGRQREFDPVQCIACMRHRGMSGMIPKRFIMMYVRRLVARLVKANLQPSKYLLERQHQPRSTLLPYATDIDTFRPSSRPSYDGRTFLYCGRLIEDKGVQVLLNAINLGRSRGHDLRLRVRGEGPYGETLRTLAADLKLSEVVSFGPFIHGEELVGEMRTACAVVVPSIWDEVVGIVALEAMACGTPVIATNVGGLGEIAVKGGLVVDRCDEESLANALVAVYESPELRLRLSRQAVKAITTDYSMTTIGAQHLALLRAVVRGHR
jgi:glycosyltransferase involved in cell wall biosynthesis